MGSTIYNFTILFFIFVYGTHANNFDLKVQVPAQMIEGSEDYMYFTKGTGSPTCSFTLNKPDGSEITTGSLVIDGFKSFTLASSLFTQITADFLATYNFDCSFQGDTINFQMESYVHSIEDFGGSSLPATFGIKIEISTQQSSPVTVSIEGGTGGPTCSITAPDANVATVDNLGPVSFQQDPMTIVVTKTGSQSSLLLSSVCSDGGKSFTSRIPVYFSATAPSPFASATGDPHFAQNVVDQSTMSTKQICYDVTGKMGDYIYIASFSNSGIKVFGQLKDDYYMHQIVIQSPSANVTVALDDILFGHKHNIEWNENIKEMTFQTNELKCEIVNDKKFLCTELKSSFQIAVEKSKHFLGEMHLDVGFGLLPKNYIEMGGLIGDIGKKEFQFFSPVQVDQNILTSEIVAVQVDKNLLKGNVVKRNGQACWLLDTNEILKPMKMTNYMFKDIN
ncbi:DgyrCDS14924 [Dimorphilus gyrociliatus]|uniref:DgyrCDS14924 n=1 Tax=Dimorphilus gyrociliatus TaxID=2664684 RepID=A0A7I8WFD1_9ANNE|nr:DgyrCDS14924 [Dimorphilus gyrociliatus]